jgi:hypothetical protein
MDTVNVILTHQPAAAVSRMVAYWNNHVPSDSVLLAYGGSRAEFERIEHPQKLYVEDPRLQTRDHQREFQSYSGLLALAADYLRAEQSGAEFVHFAEYDHLPLAQDLNCRQIERLRGERADVLGFHLQRVDGTSHPHSLYHVSNPQFRNYWGGITRRSSPQVILSMFGSGSFWKRNAFMAVAKRDEPFPMYLEIYLPTLAHHLGFRLRDFGEQNAFVHNLGDRSAIIEHARRLGAWTLHPVKKLWEEDTP